MESLKGLEGALQIKCVEPALHVGRAQALPKAGTCPMRPEEFWACSRKPEGCAGGRSAGGSLPAASTPAPAACKHLADCSRAQKSQEIAGCARRGVEAR